MDLISPRGYAYFITEADRYEEMICRVCGTHCTVERSLHGPTG